MTREKQFEKQSKRIQKKINKSKEQIIEEEKAFERLINNSHENKKDVTASKIDKPEKKKSFMPTKLTRVSPFFPINKNQIDNKNLVGLIIENQWGRLKITGEQLLIYDETIFLAVLYLVKKYNTVTVKTTQNELCKIIGVTPQPNTYNAIWNSLLKLRGTSIYIEKLNPDKTYTYNKPIEETAVSMLSKIYKNNTTRKIEITIDDYFLDVFTNKFFTPINIEIRKQLKGDITKALYRFIISQRDNPYHCHILKIIKSLNLNISMEKKEINRKINKSLQELKNNGIIKEYHRVKKDVIRIKR